MMVCFVPELAIANSNQLKQSFFRKTVLMDFCVTYSGTILI